MHTQSAELPTHLFQQNGTCKVLQHTKTAHEHKDAVRELVMKKNHKAIWKEWMCPSKNSASFLDSNDNELTVTTELTIWKLCFVRASVFLVPSSLRSFKMVDSAMFLHQQAFYQDKATLTDMESAENAVQNASTPVNVIGYLECVSTFTNGSHFVWSAYSVCHNAERACNLTHLCMAAC